MEVRKALEPEVEQPTAMVGRKFNTAVIAIATLGGHGLARRVEKAPSREWCQGAPATANGRCGSIAVFFISKTDILGRSGEVEEVVSKSVHRLIEEKQLIDYAYKGFRLTMDAFNGKQRLENGAGTPPLRSKFGRTATTIANKITVASESPCVL